jgi:hypothetical protein
MHPHPIAAAASAAALTAAVLAAPAGAATWTAPATVSSPHTFVAGLEAASSGNGTIVADWGIQDGIGASATGGARGASLAPGAALFGPEHVLPADILRVVPYAQRSVAALIFTRGSSAGRDRVAVAFGSADGPSLRAARTVGTDDVAFLPSLAMASDGTGLVAWIARASGSRRVVKVSLRAPGGRFGAPSIVSGRGRANSITTAVGARGERLVAFEKGGRLLVRLRRAGHSWGAIQDLGPVAAGTDNHLAALVTGGGRAVVADVHRQLSEGGDAGPLLVDAWVRPVGASRFGAVQRLDQADGVAASDPVLLADGLRGAIVAWVGGDPGAPATPDGASTRVRAGIMDAHARFGAPQEVSGAAQPVKGLSGASDGADAVLAWVRIDATSDGDGQVLASVRPPDGAFGAPEEASPHENASATAAALVGPPATRTPLVAWAARPGGEGPGVPLAQIRTFVRVARRAP